MSTRSELADAREVLLEMDKLVAALREENARLKSELDGLPQKFVPSDRFAPSPPPSNIFGYSYGSDGRKRTSGDMNG